MQTCMYIHSRHTITHMCVHTITHRGEPKGQEHEFTGWFHPHQLLHLVMMIRKMPHPAVAREAAQLGEVLRGTLPFSGCKKPRCTFNLAVPAESRQVLQKEYQEPRSGDSGSRSQIPGRAGSLALWFGAAKEGETMQLAGAAGGSCLISVLAEGTAVWSSHLCGTGSVWSAHTPCLGDRVGNGRYYKVRKRKQWLEQLKARCQGADGKGLASLV